MTAQPRLLIWTHIPNHYQTAFFGALRARGADLVVHYFQHVEADRLSMGWDAYSKLPPGERYVEESLRSVTHCPDWRDRIHIVPGYSRLFLLRLARFLSDQRVPWLHWSEHSEPKLRSRVTFLVKRYYGRMVRRHALGALAIGRLASEEFIRWGIPADRIRFLPYVVPRLMPEGHEPAEIPMDGPRFLFLGQLCPRKGIDLLLLAMHDVLAAHPAARLELVGNDLQNGEYVRIAERLEMLHAVTFSGVIEPARIGTALARCDALILPSRHDGWGVVLNEAASLGKALIASDACGAAHHFIEPDVNGYRFPVGDRSALAGAMLAYCRNPTLARRHGAASLRIFEDFTPQRNAQRLEEAIESLLAPAVAGVNAA